MVRVLPVCMIVLSVGLIARAGVVREINIIAEAQESQPEAGIGPVRMVEEGSFAIRSAEDLVAMSAQPAAAKDPAMQKEMEAEVMRLLGVSSIDWRKQMVLAVRGNPGTKLDRIQFESLKAEDKLLTVSFKVNQRPPHAGPGTPVALILVDRFDEVKFVPTSR